MHTKPKPSFNPWPASIIAFFAVAICGAASYAIFCARQNVELVAADYYEQEVHFQDRQDRSQRAAALPQPVTITFDATNGHIKISLSTGQPDAPTAGWIQLYRPAAAGQDQKLPLRLDDAGAQNINAKSLSAGLWHVRISWTANGTDYFCEQKVVVGRKAK